MKRKVSKKTRNVLLSLTAALLFFFLLLGGVFIPPVQNFIVGKVTALLSEKWGADLRIGKIYLTPSLKIAFEDLEIHDLRQNPMITVRKGKARLQRVTLSPLDLAFYSIELDQAEVLLAKYEGDTAVNIALWAKHLKSGDAKERFRLSAQRLALEQSRFLLHNHHTVSSGRDSAYVDYGYLELSDITFKSHDFQILGDDISAQITRLAFSQYSGFTLLDAQADFRIHRHGLAFSGGKIVTPKSSLSLDLFFDYPDWGSYADFTDSVRMRATVRPSVLHFPDIACFAKALKGMDQSVLFSGEVDGTINALGVEDFTLRLDERNILRGSLRMVGVTNFKKGRYELALRESKANPRDLAGFRLPGGKEIPIPPALYPLGDAEWEATFQGGIREFAARLDLQTQIGKASARLETHAAQDRYLFNGTLSSPGFQTDALLSGNDVLGGIALDLAWEGYSPVDSSGGIQWDQSQVDLSGNSDRLELFHYPVCGLAFHGLLRGKTWEGDILSTDTNVDFSCHGLVDLENTNPNYKGYVSVKRFAPGLFLRDYPLPDSAERKGLARMVQAARQNPALEFSFDSLEFNISGDQWDNLNGFAGVDGILFSNGLDSIHGERIRITSISLPSGLHRLILTSNFLNTTISTNYPLRHLKDSLLTAGHRYFPNIIPARHPVAKRETSSPVPSESVEERYFQVSAETFRLHEILDLFAPGVRVAPLSTCDLYISSSRENDKLVFKTRRLLFKDQFNLYNLDVEGYSTGDSRFDLALSCDSLVLPRRKNNWGFTTPMVDISINENRVSYDLQWKNRGANAKSSWLSGVVDASSRDSIYLKFLSTSLSINESYWHFNEDHQVLYVKEGLLFDNLILSSGNSSVSANGIFSFKEKDDLDIKIKNVDLSQVNTLTAGINLSFGGDISAAVRLRNWNGKRLLTGKMLVSGLVFNQAEMGNLFATAAVPENTNIAFAGGLFHRDQPFNSADITQYSIRNYNLEEHILANLSGYFEYEKKNLLIKSKIDTLELGFLAPFFQSFSQRIDGKAQGELAFYLNPDSAYLDGRVKVLDGHLGIAPLNTVYRIADQEILFNRQGITFPGVKVSDRQGNQALVTGSIRHQLFKNLRFDIGIDTRRLQVLNTVKEPDVSFYGTGFASGTIHMAGSGNYLRFSGNNLTALSGTRLYLPVMFSERVSETDGILFRSTVPEEDQIADPVKQSSLFDFDFTFNVTRDAEMFVELDPSIGGSLSAHTEGTLQVRYNTESDLNLKGLLTILSGNYQMSFRDIFLNLNMQLVEGGSITFDGGIGNSVINAKALYRTMAPVNVLDAEMPTGRTQVYAYLLLNGMLMNPSINFEFEFPNLNSDDNLRLNTAMNSGNVNSAATQFFSLVLTSNFINSGDLGRATGGDYATDAGAELFSGVINNLLFSNIGFFDELGMNMRGGSTNPDNSKTTLGLSFQGKKTIDRWVFQGDFGFQGDQANTPTSSTLGANNLIYDFSVEYMINRKGNLRAKAFVSSGNYDINSLQDENDNSRSIVAGGSLIFKVDFNNGKDIKNAFRRQKKP